MNEDKYCVIYITSQNCCDIYYPYGPYTKEEALKDVIDTVFDNEFNIYDFYDSLSDIESKIDFNKCFTQTVGFDIEKEDNEYDNYENDDNFNILKILLLYYENKSLDNINDDIEKSQEKCRCCIKKLLK